LALAVGLLLRQAISPTPDRVALRSAQRRPVFGKPWWRGGQSPRALLALQGLERGLSEQARVIEQTDREWIAGRNPGCGLAHQVEQYCPLLGL
jgi:hypothetical protein